MKEIPLLKPADIEARVQSVYTNKRGVSALLLLYKSARTDMRILDEVFGPTNWKRAHEVINGAMFCTISIYDEEKKEWVSKQDVGVPSNRDSRKGEASDAFKRAGFNWGIGRELYDAPTIFINLDPSEVDGSRGKPQLCSWVRFKVADAVYDKGSHQFTRLVIVDKNGNVRFQLGDRVTTPKKAAKPSTGNTAGSKSISKDLWDRLTAAGVDPNEFALFGYKTDFASIPQSKLEQLAENFDKCLAYFKAKTA